MKKLGLVFTLMLSVLLVGCSESKPQTRAVYMLLDTSGTYTQQIDKAKVLDLLPEKVAKYYQRFCTCPSCANDQYYLYISPPDKR